MKPPTPSPTSQPPVPPAPPALGLATLRHRQLELARHGQFAESAQLAETTRYLLGGPRQNPARVAS